MLSSRLPSAKNATLQPQNDVLRFSDSLRQIYDEVSANCAAEKRQMLHLHGFKRSLEPDYRVPFSSESDTEICREETIKMLEKLRTNKNKRANQNRDNISTHFDHLKAGTTKPDTRKRPDESHAAAIENTLYSHAIPTNSSRKLKLTSLRAKDIPENVSQYSFSPNSTSSLGKTFENKVAKPKSVSKGSEKNTVAVNHVLSKLEAEYNTKMVQQREARHRAEQESQQAHDLATVQARVAAANRRISRFESGSERSRFQGGAVSRFESRGQGSRFESRGQRSRFESGDQRSRVGHSADRSDSSDSE